METKSNWKGFAQIKAFGHPADPTIILGHHFDAGGYWIKEELCDMKNRMILLQFLLLGKENHIMMCFRFVNNKWILYDDDAVKLGIPEIGEDTGAQPFYSCARSSVLDLEYSEKDVEMEDLSGYVVAIPENSIPFYSCARSSVLDLEYSEKDVEMEDPSGYVVAIPENSIPFYSCARSSVLDLEYSEKDVEMEDPSGYVVAIPETNYSVALPMLLQVLMSDGWFSYIKADALFCSYQLKRSCVLDSLLAAFHITFNIFPNVECLFNTDELIQKLMTLLNARKYAEAKVICAKQLNHVRFDHALKEIDYFGRLEDHSSLFYNLECAEMKHDQKIPNDSPICEDILSNLKGFACVKALGHPDDPTVFLGYYFNAGGYWIEEELRDKKHRIFRLQFVLLGKEKHMTMCYRVSNNDWILYDNDLAKPTFQSLSSDQIKDCVICLAGYVNISQAQEYKLGISETGDVPGAKPFYSCASGSFLDFEHSVEDAEMEDLSSYSVAIPKTSERLGSQPFYM